METKFEKVSFGQFIYDLRKVFPSITDERVREIYDNIKLPKRATKGSAGYDFFAPYEIEMHDGDVKLIPTGIRIKLPEDKVLKIYPRSGHGFKYNLQLANTVGIIDSDYYNSDNQGHIMIKLIKGNIGGTLKIEEGKGLAQGIIEKYYITDDDECSDTRNGGFGSTDKKPTGGVGYATITPTTTISSFKY